MNNRIRVSVHLDVVRRTKLFLFAAASLLAALACSDPIAPEKQISAPEFAGLQTVVVDGPEDVPLEDGAQLPAQFYAAPLISKTFIDAGFLPKLAWATASMEYFANHATLSLYVKVKRFETIVDRDSAHAANDELFPFSNRLVARVNISMPADCGYRSDANASFTAWMAFPIPKTGSLFAWGHITQPLATVAYQPECEELVYGGSSTEWIDDLLGGDEDDGYTDDEAPWRDDEYEGICQFCQFWYAVRDGEIVAAWLECTETDDSYCADIGAAM